MKFVHIADVHFDTPFTTLSVRENLGEKRRLEQRKAFKKVIDFIKENNVDYFLIAGDLYEEQYIRKSTIDYINSLFEEIPETKILMVPGNHDPYLKNSYYAMHEWSENVRIFTEKVEIIKDDKVDIYGYGFNDFEMTKDLLPKVEIEDRNKINILITHGDVYNKSQYNPINQNELKEKGFDYIALGHLHKRDEFYPGSLISLGFDEPGKHGFSYIEITDDKNINVEFIKVDNREFNQEYIDISKYSSQEELIEELNSIDTGENLYEIYLTGERNFDTNINIKLLQDGIVKIKDKSKFKIERNTNDKTLSGIFEKRLEERLQAEKIDEETFEKILELENRIMRG